MYSNIAIIKPDHVGDLVLAIPAINWMASQVRRASLFVAPANLALARHLFSNLEIRSIQFDHLSKTDRSSVALKAVLAPFRDFDAAIFLRADAVINRAKLTHFLERLIITEPRDEVHESVIHRRCVSQYFGAYRPDEFWSRAQKPFDSRARKVGLCVASGFPTNKWSIIRWVDLARRLASENAEIFLIGGSGELSELQIIARATEVPQTHLIIGDSRFELFLAKVAELDVVIASDGGGGHLCSLVAPVLTVAGSSPFRRYAPFGMSNRVISLDLPCSPCLNADSERLNGCFSHECSYGVQVDDVLNALRAPDAEPGTRLRLGTGATLFYAPSHAEIPR
jgi:heptosyltransferase-2